MVEDKDFRHIVRVVNTDLDGNKPIKHALMKIKGVGFMLANVVCNCAKVDKGKKTGVLSDEEIMRLDDVIKNPLKYSIPAWMLNRRKDYDTNENLHVTGPDASFVKQGDIKRLQKVKSYRGMRHAWKLPVRGQRTRSNFRPNKGNVMGVKRRSGVRAGRV
ncbi:30S ribosomal protein S13 [Candidatus Woesearchaeota archaeon RBG_13_36_6]|nr:MAG: 30S ribosomal protein S13 [Candidatus Woesearchaeota archaeon RBG_13_36_6]